MSLRTLIEINHDQTTGMDTGLLVALDRYIRSASRENAERLEPYGIKVLGMRHHSSNFILEGTPDGFPVSYLRAPPSQGNR